MRLRTDRRLLVIIVVMLLAVSALLSMGMWWGWFLAAEAAAHDPPLSQLAFASEPVKAKWEPPAPPLHAAAAPPGASGAGNAAASPPSHQWKFPHATPATAPGPASRYLRDGKVLLDNTMDVTIGNWHVANPDFGILVNNTYTAERVLIDNFQATECTEYGCYVDGARDWWIRNSTFSLCKDANQHGLRIAYAERFRVSDTLIDTCLADKTTIWVLNGSMIELRNLKLVGGRNWFSIDPDNPELPDGKVTGVVIADCWIDLDQEWANALEFMPGVDDVEITNLHVRAERPPIGVWSSVGGVPAARNIRWKDIWIPAPGQPKDKPFDELEWVKLRDDDWERILSHKGRTRSQVIADGIGPMAAVTTGQ